MQHRFSVIFPHPCDTALSRDAWSLFASPGARHFAAVSMRPPLRIPLSRPRFMPVPDRKRRMRTPCWNGSERRHPAPLCASPMAREMYVAGGGGFHKRRYFRVVRPCAIGLWCLIYSDRKKRRKTHDVSANSVFYN